MTDEFKKVQMKDIETQMKNHVTESETYATLAAVLDNDENRDIAFSSTSKSALYPHKHSKIFVKFAKFCDYYLRNLVSTDGNQKEVYFDSEQYASTIVQYGLKAMEECSKEASELFPRLLQIISIYDNAQSTFKQSVVIWPYVEIYSLDSSDCRHFRQAYCSMRFSNIVQSGIAIPQKPILSIENWL
ncbi:DNA-dependent protein kinase catalytic subunit [Gigaspora margarita]|uniref:DNA-dependent protein kinase catalytic subunit n=1 Tax=Gigaspora margarita TaxID=4874 RepID=A0A8H4EFV1_GIGMA|nr:DNA-dependent protein kinase catalytic subunit [Gigaspora margarita]